MACDINLPTLEGIMERSEEASGVITGSLEEAGRVIMDRSERLEE